jgi:hypothetical protein
MEVTVRVTGKALIVTESEILDDGDIVIAHKDLMGWVINLPNVVSYSNLPAFDSFGVRAYSSVDEADNG